MKNFTNNFKQFTLRLSARWLIMALMLLLGTSSAWALNQPAKDLYFDNSTSQWTNCYVYIGHGSHTSCYDMSRVSGTQYLWKLPSNFNGGNSWDNADGWVVCNEKWWISKGESIYKFVHHGEKNVTDITKSAWEDNKIYKTNGTGNVTHDNKTTNVYKITSITKYDYTVTINQSTGGTLTVKDYDDNTVSTGASKIYLTVLKFSASASTGYTFKEVQINNGSSTTTIPAANIDQTYTVTSNVTITPVWEKACAPSATLSSAVYDAVNNEIDLNGSIAPCGKTLFYGFLWKEKKSDWVADNAHAISGTGGSNNKTKENKEFAHSWDGFTPSTTYEFTAYALDATTNPYTWYFSTDENNVIEVSTCTTIPDNTYAIAGNNVWTGNANPVTINYDANTYGTPTILYDGEELIPTKVGTYAITIDVPAHNGYCASTISLGDYEITCIDVEKPDITTSATICEGTQVTLSAYNNSNIVKWYSNSACTEEVTEQVTPTNGKVYYAKAYHKESGCYSSEYSTLTFTVNPQPTISIGDNTNAVKFEDVKLTATGNNIDDVTWTADKGTITKDPTDPKRAVLTYDQTGTVTVTATATSVVGCESAEVRKKVTFGEEDCNSTTTTVQKPVGKVKITCTSKPSDWSKLYCYLWTTEGTKKEPLGTWGGKEIAVNSAQIVNVESKKFKIIFHNGSGTQTADSQELNPDKIYNLKINYANNSHTISVEEKGTYKEPVEETVDPEITAPAAKTISVSTTEGEGNIIFSGQVVKTGCANALTYGFAYSTDANADKSNWTKVACVNTGNTAGTQYNGKKTGIEVDGTYYVCAYITNSAGTTYGAVTEITISTTKTPISNVTLNYCDKNGGNVGVDPNPMCKGAIAYVKLSYVGSKYSDIKWLVEGVETNLVTDEGDGVWSYEIQGDGSLSVELKNDANTDPAWPYSNKLAFTIIPEPTAPYISIDPASGVICQGSSATIKVENPSKDCSYKLVEEGSKAGFEPYKSGDLTYTVQNVAKYYVVAQHNACTANEYTSNQVAITQVISTSAKISIEPENQETTPWEPVNITITADEGYIYEVTYTSNNLANVDGVIIKQNGDTYTYRIPRPATWGTGNAPTRTPVIYGIKAQLKVDGEANQCNLSSDTATIKVIDEENEKCD